MRLYVDDKEAVREDAQQDSRKLLALDVTPGGRRTRPSGTDARSASARGWRGADAA